MEDNIVTTAQYFKRKDLHGQISILCQARIDAFCDRADIRIHVGC
jgi:hypothetical protein